jgi:flavin-dependent dehydrogenase
VGVDGGFSTLSVQIDFKHGEVDLLSGSTADGTHRSGPKLIADFVQREGWIGRKVFGGSGAIPLRRPYAAMVAPGIALVGDSACQVFPAHGSGIGTGLIAGRLLAEATAERADPGERSGLWRYQHAFMREVGAVSAAYDVIRQLSQRLSDEEAISLIASGLTTPALASATLAQEMASPSIGDLAGLLQGVRAAPKLAAKLAPAIAKMRAAHLLYRGFPENPDGLWAAMWERLHARLFPAPAPMAANEPEFESFREAA